LMVTDPPYGVLLDTGWRERAGLGPQRQTGSVPNDDRADWSQAYQLFPGDVAYVWHAGVHAAEVAAGLEACGLRIRAQIIWAKQHFALAAEIFTGSTSHVGIACGKANPPTGAGIENNRHCGKLRI
jgi:hypothetical protein